MSTQESAFDNIETIQIGDHPTDIVYHRFANKSFLLITQRQKVTNVYTVRNQACSSEVGPLTGGGGSGQAGRIYSIKHTFGAASDEAEAAIRYLMNFIDRDDEIVITLGLKQIDKASLDQIGAQLRRIV